MRTGPPEGGRMDYRRTWCPASPGTVGPVVSGFSRTVIRRIHETPAVVLVVALAAANAPSRNSRRPARGLAIARGEPALARFHCPL